MQVIVTGSQIPAFETRSDGRDNLVGALIMANLHNIYTLSTIYTISTHYLHYLHRWEPSLWPATSPSPRSQSTSTTSCCAATGRSR